jgi:hypothetical protein
MQFLTQSVLAQAPTKAPNRVLEPSVDDMLYPKRPVVALAFVVVASLATSPAVQAAAPVSTAPTGAVVGHVIVCDDANSGAEHPDANVKVVAVGTSISAQTDDQGAFTLSGIPAEDDAAVAVVDAAGNKGPQRTDVPVWGGQVLDIGDLVVGASIFGCGPDGD